MDANMRFALFTLFFEPLFLYGVFARSKELRNDNRFKKVDLSLKQKKILLISKWDNTNKMDAVYHKICIVPFVYLVIAAYLFGLTSILLYCFNIQMQMIFKLTIIVCCLAPSYLVFSNLLFGIIEFVCYKMKH